MSWYHSFSLSPIIPCSLSSSLIRFWIFVCFSLALVPLRKLLLTLLAFIHEVCFLMAIYLFSHFICTFHLIQIHSYYGYSWVQLKCIVLVWFMLVWFWLLLDLWYRRCVVVVCMITSPVMHVLLNYTLSIWFVLYCSSNRQLNNTTGDFNMASPMLEHPSI